MSTPVAPAVVPAVVPSTGPVVDPAVPPVVDPATPPVVPPVVDPDTDPADLGEAGKKAIAAERTARKAAEKDAADAKAENARLRRSNAATTGTDLEGIKAEMRAEFTTQLVRAEVKAAAAGRLTDPSDALRLLDLEGLSATGTGEVNEAAIRAAIDKLLVDKPYLAATSTEKHWGHVGGGQPNTSEPEPDSPEARMARAYGKPKAR